MPILTPHMVAWAVRSYGGVMCYEVAVLDHDGQFAEDSYSTECPHNDWNTTVKWARATAAEIATEHGIPLRKGLVFQDQELMITAAEVRDIP